MKHLQDLHVLILGLGASGLAMARWCARHGAHVTVADTREAPPQLATLQHDVQAAVFVGGPFSAALVEGTPVRAVYRSPGLAPATIASVVDAARAMGLPVGGELDLFAQALKDLATVEAVAVAEPVAEVAAIEPAPQAEIEMSEQAPQTLEPAKEVTAEEQAPQPEALAAETLAAQAAAEPAVEAHVEAPAPTPAKGAHVHTAAREAAEFVARIAELSVPAAIAPAEEEPTLPLFAPEPPPPRGYTPAVLAVTGTNGKTTVTALTGQLVERAGKTVAVAGNIGPTLLDTLSAHIDADTLPEVWVLELSSFQLDGVQGFEPTAATVLNLTQDHLDWHGDMAAYAAAKARVFGATGLMVLNRDDAGVMTMLSSAGPPQAAKALSGGSDYASAQSVGARRLPPARAKLQRPQIRTHITFGANMPARPGDFGIERINGMGWLVRALEADETIKRKRGSTEEQEIHMQRLMPADALRIRGQHNALNALAALALAGAAGCALSPMLHGLREYRGEPHRVEPVAIVDEVEYFDDSKGTNVGATVAALSGLGVDRRVVVILGGDGKGQDFSPLADPVARYARSVVLMGRDAPIIAAALESTGVSLLNADTLPEAVTLAAARANPGDAVLLSPACASFDMFRGYEHRAEVFCDAVHALAHEPRHTQGETA